MKLAANLVPLRLWGFNARNIGDRQWEKIKKKARSESNNCCVICEKDMQANLRDLHTHEFWEYDSESKVAKIIKISSVCVDCHAIIHLGDTVRKIKKIGDTNRLKYLNEHFVNANGLPPSQYALQGEYRRAMAEWRERNAIEWTLDLSILSQYGVDIPVLDDEQIVAIKKRFA